MSQILVPPVTQLLGSKWLNFFFRCTERKNFDLKSWVTWVETKTFKLVTGSLILLLKLLISKIHQNYCYINYILKMILKMILKSFDFQCDFDFQITTSKMISILILNHLYLGDLILILKSSTYDHFAHLWVPLILLLMIPIAERKQCSNKVF